MIEFYVAVGVLIICLYFKWQFSYWRRRKVDGPSGTWPIFGDMIEYATMRKHYGLVYEEFYHQFPKASYVGFYKMGQPAILVRDMDLVKDVLASHFSSFHDNDFIIDPKLDPLLSVNPFVVTGEKWKISRAQATSLFSPQKIKPLFPLTKQVCNHMIEYIECGPESLSENGFETKSLATKFIIDNIASCAFGVEGECFTSSDSEFAKMSRSIFDPSIINMIRNSLVMFLPFLSSILRVSFISSKVDKFVRKMLKDIIKVREETKLQRNDLLQAVLQLKEKEKISDVTVAGHALTFLTEGSETSNTLIAYALYVIAVNPNIQRRLQTEVDEVLEKNSGEMNAEAISDLTYMDLVLFETLRLYTPVFAITRLCTKSFELPPQYSDSKERATVEPGTPIIIPIYAIHRDPEIYHQPYNFDPERFTDENKKSRHNYSFLGFGEGPRICLGNKFAMLQVKAGLSAILSKFDIKLSSKTVEPLKISNKAFLLICEEGIWVKFYKRNL